MNRKTRLYLLVHEEYVNTTNPNDPIIDFYLNILDQLWLQFLPEEIQYVTERTSGRFLNCPPPLDQTT